MTKKKTASKRKSKSPGSSVRGVGYPLSFRLRIVQEVVEGGMSKGTACRAFGISKTTLDHWLRKYDQGGADALTPRPRGRKPAAASARTETRRQAVVEVRQEHPEFGTRRVRDVLARFEALGVSETEVRRILHEAGMIEQRPQPAREHPPRSFERAEPNQLWQSDIFTFLLRKHERLYLAGFMDDHSRYLVSHCLAHHQRSSLVMEALSRGIADYGAPHEILTDQGRQYTAWRGETEFEAVLRQHGIRHIKSRPQHPQTLGKVERFWKTLWDEFLSRTVFADFADCTRRIALFVHAYNFQRPHQALGGLVPADRFFRAAQHVRAAIEQGITDNAMRLAREQPTRKPFYLVGRLGDQDLSIAAAGDGLRVQVGTSEPQTISLPKESEHEEQEVGARSEQRFTQEASETAGAGLDQQEQGEIAKRRCLLVLSVLSGEVPVTDAIEQAQISRPLYYDLESRALRGMLQALTPQHAASQDSTATSPAQRIAELEAKVARLERDKRRAERLLLLTRHVVKSGPLTTGAGRKRAPRKSSRAGSKPSERSMKPTLRPSSEPCSEPSPTLVGGAGR